VSALTRIGWIGTGVMGSSMCGRLLDAGYAATVYSRTRERAEPLLEKGATWSDSPAAVAEASDVVFTMLGFPVDVRDVVLGRDGVLSGARRGSVLVDTTTSEPALAEEIHRAAHERGVTSIDAPVSGGDVGARNATLSIMVGGSAEGFERALPLFQRLGKTIILQGPAGAGQYTKLCNQVAIASTMLSVCESMALAKASGLDPTRVLESITPGAAGSWALANLMPRALRGDFEPGFAVQHFLKDLAIALACAQRLGLELPGLILAQRLYEELRQQGAASKGTQVLLRRYLEQGAPS
jgi:3-hydroxyisobutyrate dehydrogenase